MSRNRKKLWSQPSFTIQASGRQAPIHPAGAPMEHVGKDRYVFSDGEENNRRLSVKEIARIQTFPDWYEFSRGTNSRNDNAKLDLVYKQIGNAGAGTFGIGCCGTDCGVCKDTIRTRKRRYKVCDCSKY